MVKSMWKKSCNKQLEINAFYGKAYCGLIDSVADWCFGLCTWERIKDKAPDKLKLISLLEAMHINSHPDAKICTLEPVSSCTCKSLFDHLIKDPPDVFHSLLPRNFVKLQFPQRQRYLHGLPLIEGSTLMKCYKSVGPMKLCLQTSALCVLKMAKLIPICSFIAR